MGITTEHDRARDLTIFRASGELTYEMQIEALSRFYAGEPTPNVLWDMREIRGNRVSSGELQRIVAFAKQHTDKRARGKTALVVGSKLDFGLSRQVDAYADNEQLPWKIRPFLSLRSALTWIEED